jgi:regulator of RNase E activity RraB
MNLPEADRTVLQQLADHGDDPDIVRPVVHWLFGSEADLREVGIRLAAMGWTDTDPREDGEGWLISPVKLSDLRVDAVASMNEEVASASQNLEITFDGWETSVEQSN